MQSTWLARAFTGKLPAHVFVTPGAADLLTWSDVVGKSGGASPFGNAGARYIGSADDAALNAAVTRFKAKAAAVARFAADVDHRGRFGMPVLSIHGIKCFRPGRLGRVCA